MAGATNNLKNQVDFIIEWRNNTTTKPMEKLINKWVQSIFTRKSSFKKRLKQISKPINFK